MEFEKISDRVVFRDGVLRIPTDVFSELSEKSFTVMRRFFREDHLRHWREILDSPESSEGEKRRMYRNLKASVEAKKSGVPYCQDTGSDVVYIFRGNRAIFEGQRSVEDEIQHGAVLARKNNPYRSSVFIPQSTYFGDEESLKITEFEKNSGNNQPPEIHFFSHSDDWEVEGIFSNKGGGSGSKLWSFSLAPGLYQNPQKLINFLGQKIAEIGHSACPPYQLRIVLGGLSHFHNSAILTRSTVDDVSFLGSTVLESKLQGFNSYILRDRGIEKKLTQALKKSNLGAQGDGKFFVMPDGIRVFRAPRHAAHFFVGVGVACSAHRVQSFRINKDGVFLEKLCETPEKFLPPKNSFSSRRKLEKVEKINLDEDRDKVLEILRNLRAGEEFLVSGHILGARDKAHARWQSEFEKNGKIPEYLQKYLSVIYVGPSDTPKGEIIGSFGPTTAGRMDEFSEFLLARNLLPLSIGKGSRSRMFSENCKKYRGMFAAVQGGPASLLRKFVKSVEILDFEDLGMEAVRVYKVEDLPVQMVVDSCGRDFYEDLAKGFLKVL